MDVVVGPVVVANTYASIHQHDSVSIRLVKQASQFVVSMKFGLHKSYIRQEIENLFLDVQDFDE